MIKLTFPHVSTYIKPFKRLFILILFLLTSSAKAQVWKSYIVHVGDNESTPLLTGKVGTYYEFNFILDKSWNQLYQLPDNSTHKVTGVSDTFGKNSIRLGVRRSPNALDGIIAVCYGHVNGKISYPAIKDPNGKPVLLHYDQEYNCKIYQSGQYWFMVVSAFGIPLGTASLQVNIPSGLFGRRLSGIWVEIASDPSPFEIKTDVNIIKK